MDGWVLVEIFLHSFNKANLYQGFAFVFEKNITE